MLTSKIHQFSASFVLDEGNPRIIFSRPKEFPRDNDAKWYHQHMSPRQNGQHFPHDIFKCIFVNENAKISIKISLKFIPKCPINYIPALVKIMAWCQPGDKPLSEPTMTHICVTRPTAQLLFKIRFPKGGPTCRRQVVNPRHQTPQGQSVAKPETPLLNIEVE